MIAVIGGGWFGCHIAATLKRRGVVFEMFESQSRLFDGASGYNQNRLHLGFHYPRSAKTRRQSKEGYHTFLREYPDLSEPIENNLYAVCSRHSLVDFETYELVMRNSGMTFDIVRGDDHGLINIDGCLRCDERVICTNKARAYFTKLLSRNLRLNQSIDSSNGYDYIVNCTYQTWRSQSKFDVCYEPCVVLIYSSAERHAVTLMDGPFYSVYPYQDGLHTLYSVRHSPLARCSTYAEAKSHLDGLDADLVGRLRETMELDLMDYYPAFSDLFRFEGFHQSVRCRSKDISDARVCYVTQDGNVIHVMSGKIDSIFHAEAEVMRYLGYQ